MNLLEKFLLQEKLKRNPELAKAYANTQMVDSVGGRDYRDPSQLQALEASPYRPTEEGKADLLRGTAVNSLMSSPNMNLKAKAIELIGGSPEAVRHLSEEEQMTLDSLLNKLMRGE